MKKKIHDWVMFTKRTEFPKLGYIIDWCRTQGIPTRIVKHSMHAPILEVPEHFLGKANRVLEEKVTKTGRRSRFGHSRFDDIEDDHAMFVGFEHTKPDFE